MNELQTVLANVIKNIVMTPGIFDGRFTNDLEYGLGNYIARFSLASDQYYASELVSKVLGSDSKGPTFNRNYLKKTHHFKYEHAVPGTVVRKEIRRMVGLEKNAAAAGEQIFKILKFADCVTILADAEMAKVDAVLRSKMPEGWTYFEGDKFARYLAAGIVIAEPKMGVTGALKR